MTKKILFFIIVCLIVSILPVYSVESVTVEIGDEDVSMGEDWIPEWAKCVVWYQIFPERFRNGDPSNDPKVENIEGSWPHDHISPWEVHSWTSDWYELRPYEKENNGWYIISEDTLVQVANIIDVEKLQPLTNQKLSPVKLREKLEYLNFNDEEIELVFSNAENEKSIWFDIQRRRYGGDLQGIIDKLDYLEDLGITAIYLNPVFESPSLHKYDGITYHHIDPNFGPDPDGDRDLIASEIPDDRETWVWTSADKLFLELVKEVHKRDMKIIIDGVFNHIGLKNPFFSGCNEKSGRLKIQRLVYCQIVGSSGNRSRV